MAFDLPGAFWGTMERLDGVESVRGDVTDPDLVNDACRDVDIVVHLAALLPPRSEGNRELTLRVNVEGTWNIVKALKGTGGAMVFASSISTYGITGGGEPPVDESRPLRAHNVYSESKIRAEGVLEGSGVPHIIMRVAPVAVADLLEPPEVVPYRADQRVEFITVPDAALAFYNAATTPEAIGKTLNIAGGGSWQMTGREYLEGFYGALGVEVELNFSEEYTAVDWYDTSKSLFLGYQKTSFNEFQRKLGSVAEELGLI
ncbi:NAD(P)-dependent oxidoreductase [Candidatus Bathyarchaeota archaeon]|nr:NAD(P)-dependent oxidoreductase [Candidatus Bathyarchaeota archaeon]